MSPFTKIKSHSKISKMFGLMAPWLLMIALRNGAISFSIFSHFRARVKICISNIVIRGIVVYFLNNSAYLSISNFFSRSLDPSLWVSSSNS